MKLHECNWYYCHCHNNNSDNNNTRYYKNAFFKSRIHNGTSGIDSYLIWDSGFTVMLKKKTLWTCCT